MTSTQQEPSGARPGEPDTADEVIEKVTHSPLLSLLAILLAAVAGVLMGWSFLSGIAEALKPVPHNSLWIALFFVGTGLDIVAIVFGVVGILRRAHRALSVVGLILALVPGLVVLVIAALRFL